MKHDERKKLLKKRMQLSFSEVTQKSNQIKKTLFSLEIFHASSSILYYISYGKEVDTHKMIQESLAVGKNVIVPKVLPNNGTLLLSRLLSWNDLEKGCYGILEPTQNSIRQIDINMVDLIVVPIVGFDLQRNRIGHGKGYYDKLLYKNQHIPTIGLAFECQMVNDIDKEDHDIKIDMIITEKRIIT
ncbi:MAG: 5-formyltetrahydrofolate cyclo-ligase [Thermoplasmatota archaeon]